jgi:CheY-like chemotaxis protein
MFYNRSSNRSSELRKHMGLSPWTAPGSHSIQFYDNEPFIHHAIAEFLTQDANSDEALILVCRPRTFDAVAKHLESGWYGPALDDADRILFVDAEAALPQIMDGQTFNPVRAERLFKDVLSQAGSSPPSVRLYGEIVDMLCEQGRHTTALQFEGLASVLLGVNPRLSILCGYALERFKEDTDGVQLRAVCQKHTHVIPAENFTDALDERVWRERGTTLQHSALSGMPGAPSRQGARTSGSAVDAPFVYVIDDNPSVRRSLKRLLTLHDWPVQTFDSAEAFWAELGNFSNGCLIVDIGLPGMSGLDLVRRLRDAGFQWPFIAISGQHDKKTEDEALRLGARAYLHKPFDSQALLDTIARALS